MEISFDKMSYSLSDYGSGSSSNLSWNVREKQTPLPRPKSEYLEGTSYLDMVSMQYRVEDVRREFQMNGSDSPYNPDEDKIWKRQPGLHKIDAAGTFKERPMPSSGIEKAVDDDDDACTFGFKNKQHEELSGMGPTAVYLRQKSWPEPERSPAPRLPRPRSLVEPRWDQTFATSTPVFEDIPPPPFPADVPPSEVYGALSAEQARVLSSLPNDVLYPLLRQLRHDRRNKQPQECRFCKNNGERASFYRSHTLKDSSGRVSCPVLRAFTCRRCGARGDAAHTIKYCPLTTNDERIQSSKMMHSVRMGSGRRRHSMAPPVSEVQDYIVFGEPTPSVIEDTNAFNYELDPLWAALERKLEL